MSWSDYVGQIVKTEMWFCSAKQEGEMLMGRQISDKAGDGGGRIGFSCSSIGMRFWDSVVRLCTKSKSSLTVDFNSFPSLEGFDRRLLVFL